MKTILTIILLVSLTGCGISYGNFRAGTPSYLKELRRNEQPSNMGVIK